MFQGLRVFGSCAHSGMDHCVLEDWQELGYVPPLVQGGVRLGIRPTWVTRIISWGGMFS